MKANLLQLFAFQIVWKSTSTSARGYMDLAVLESPNSTPAESVIALHAVAREGKWVFDVIYPGKKSTAKIAVPFEILHGSSSQHRSSASKQACDNVQSTGLFFRGKQVTDLCRSGVIRKDISAKRKPAQSLCDNDYIFSSYLVAALLKNQQNNHKIIYSFEWDGGPNPVLYTHSTFHRQPKQGPEDCNIHYHTHFLTPENNCERALGPIYATVRLVEIEEKAQAVLFDYGRVISEVPRHIFEYLSQKLNAIDKRNQPSEDISGKFLCSHEVYSKMPTISFFFDGDKKRCSFTSRNYIIEIFEKYADSEVFTGKCYMAVTPHKNNDKGHWTIGATFAKGYFTRLKRSETKENAIEFGFESSQAYSTNPGTTKTVPEHLKVSFDVAM